MEMPEAKIKSKRSQEFCPETWTGPNNDSIVVNLATGVFTLGRYGGDEFRLECRIDEDGNESASCFSSSHTGELYGGCKLKGDRQWMVFYGDMTREDTDPYLAFAKIISNTL